MHRYFHTERADLIDAIDKKQVIDSELENELKAAMDEFIKQFSLVM